MVENPNLHLIWHYKKIFIKPIPRYMLSHAFWEYLKVQDQDVWRACAGFMRTYSYLIQYEIDFRRATSLGLALIPIEADGNTVTFERFAEFILPFSQLSDTEVTPRFEWGELRLTRLNMLTRIFLFKRSYHHIEAQWSTFFGQFLSPFLTFFVLVTIVLNSMQVELTAEAQQAPRSLSAFAKLSIGFSIVVLVLVLTAFILLIGLSIVMLLCDFFFARAVTCRKQHNIHAASNMKSSVV